MIIFTNAVSLFIQIIDPFVEVEIIGLPVDCCKDQTRVVDDNGKMIIGVSLDEDVPELVFVLILNNMSMQGSNKSLRSISAI